MISVDILFVKAEDLKVGTDNEKNIVKVYYSKDDNKDNIPDKYQIAFTYESADDNKGNCDRNNPVRLLLYRLFSVMR